MCFSSEQTARAIRSGQQQNPSDHVAYVRGRSGNARHLRQFEIDRQATFSCELDVLVRPLWGAGQAQGGIAMLQPAFGNPMGEFLIELRLGPACGRNKQVVSFQC